MGIGMGEEKDIRKEELKKENLGKIAKKDKQEIKIESWVAHHPGLVVTGLVTIEFEILFA